MNDHTLVYISKATRRVTHADLLALAAEAQLRNARCGVTGLLLYSGDHFLQVIEGRDHVLNMLFNKIKPDKRHTDVEQLLYTPTRDRIFGDWAMGVLDISQSKDLDRGMFRFICDQAACDPAAASRAAMTVLKMFRKDLGDDGVQTAA